MLRSVALTLALFACHTASSSTEPNPCPGQYAITQGACDPVSPGECRGVCGVVLRRRDCTPVPHTILIVEGANVSASTDKNGRFELPPVEAGHHKIRVMAEQDDAVFEIDAIGTPVTLPAPLELTLLDRSCWCGGACTS